MESKLIYTNKGNKDILISFVIPTYKRSKYLSDAILSIIQLDRLENIGYEIIIVNNDPNDLMEELVNRFKDYHISFYQNMQNYGQVGNINQGISLAMGKYVALLHDDDVLLTNYISEVLLSIDRNPNALCIIPSQYDIYNEYHFDFKHRFISFVFLFRYFYRRVEIRLKVEDCIYSFRDIYNPPTCGTIFNRELLNRNGLFDDKNGAAWDYYNFRKLNINNEIVLLHRFLGIRRMFTGMSNQKKIIDEFKKDEIEFVEEYRNNGFINKYGESMIEKKGIKNIIGRIKKNFYFYTRNLDSVKMVNRTIYKSFYQKYVR